MKFAILTPTNVVRSVYNDVYNPTILPEEEKLVFSNGKIENIGKNYILVEDHIPVQVGEVLEEALKDYDLSHNFIKHDFKGLVEEAVEEIKDLFTGDDKGKSK